MFGLTTQVMTADLTPRRVDELRCGDRVICGHGYVHEVVALRSYAAELYRVQPQWGLPFVATADVALKTSPVGVWRLPIESPNERTSLKQPGRYTIVVHRGDSTITRDKAHRIIPGPLVHVHDFPFIEKRTAADGSVTAECQAALDMREDMIYRWIASRLDVPTCRQRLYEFTRAPPGARAIAHRPTPRPSMLKTLESNRRRGSVLDVECIGSLDIIDRANVLSAVLKRSARYKGDRLVATLPLDKVGPVAALARSLGIPVWNSSDTLNELIMSPGRDGYFGPRSLRSSTGCSYTDPITVTMIGRGPCKLITLSTNPVRDACAHCGARGRGPAGDVCAGSSMITADGVTVHHL